MRKFLVGIEGRRFPSGQLVSVSVARVPMVGDFIQLPDKPDRSGRVNSVLLVTSEGEIDAFVSVTEVSWGVEVDGYKKINGPIQFMEPPDDLNEQIAGAMP